MMDGGDPAAWPTTLPAGQAPTEAPAEDDFLSLPPEGQQCLQEFWNSLPLDGESCRRTTTRRSNYLAVEDDKAFQTTMR